jgi:hypothetical protein
MKKNILLAIYSLLCISSYAQCELDFSFSNTGTNMSIFFTPNTAESIFTDLGPGQIGAFYEDNDAIFCGASVTFTGEQILLPVMADDSTTPEKDGFSANEQLTWYYQTESGDVFSIELNPSSLFVVNAVSYITSVSISEVLCDGGSTGVEGDCPSLIFDAFNTGSNMTLFLTPSGASALSAIGNGTIGVYFQNSEGSEVCGGSASFNGAQVQVTAYADDSTTPEKDGFAAGESITWKYQDNSGNQFNLIPEPEDVFVINATSFISSMSYSAITCLAEEVLGCTDQNAFNYDSSANTEDGSCIAVVYGCTDSNALNYDSNANTDDGSCIAVIGGCTDPSAFNYNSNANTDDGSCVEVIEGCIDISASNYDASANTPDNSCISWEEAYQNCVSSGGMGEFSQSDIDDAYQSGFLAADDGIGQAQLDAQADISYTYGYGEGFAAADDGIGQTELDAQADLSYGYGYGEGYDEGVNVSSGSCETIFIDLISGWNIIGYTLPFPQDITATLSSIVDNINIMKNNDADVFWPEYGFNGIGDFIPGQGYQILMLNSISEYFYPDVSGERVEMTPTVPYWAHDLPILCHPNDSRSLVKVVNMLGQEVDIKSQFKGELLLHLYNDGTVEKHLVE